MVKPKFAGYVIIYLFILKGLQKTGSGQDELNKPCS